MEENGRKWKEMGKSVVDVQIEGVFSIDPSKLRYKYRYRMKIDHSKDTDTKITPKIEIQNNVINIIYNRFELYGSSSSSNYNTDDIIIHICCM